MTSLDLIAHMFLIGFVAGITVNFIIVGILAYIKKIMKG